MNKGDGQGDRQEGCKHEVKESRAPTCAGSTLKPKGVAGCAVLTLPMPAPGPSSIGWMLSRAGHGCSAGHRVGAQLGRGWILSQP